MRVSYREQPITGLKIILSVVSGEAGQNVGEVIATASTDTNGTAHFFAVPSGVYRAHVEKALLAESREIHVQADDPSEDKIYLEWPNSPIVTGNLRGRIFSWQKSTPQNRAELLPHKSVFVQLLDLRSGKPLASVHTDSEGYYEFPSYPDGSYVMRVGEHSDPSINSYDNAVEVARDVTQGDMPDLVVDEVCGNGLVEMMDQADAQTAASIAPGEPK